MVLLLQDFDPSREALTDFVRDRLGKICAGLSI